MFNAKNKTDMALDKPTNGNGTTLIGAGTTLKGDISSNSDLRIDGTIIGKGGKVYQRRTGFCMEPQHYPDSPNQPDFPSTELKPGQTFHNTIIYKFSVK